MTRNGVKTCSLFLFICQLSQQFYFPAVLLNCNCLCFSAESLQSCLTLCDPIDGSPSGSRPWDSPGKNTGVGCHFLLQCMKVKSESEVAQSCLTFSDPMDRSPPGSPVHGIFQARVLEWVCFPRATLNAWHHHCTKFTFFKINVWKTLALLPKC